MARRTRSDSGRWPGTWRAGQQTRERPERTGAGIVPAAARGGCERALHLRVECQLWLRLLPVPDPPCSSALPLPCCRARCGLPSTLSLSTGMDAVVAGPRQAASLPRRTLSFEEPLLALPMSLTAHRAGYGVSRLDPPTLAGSPPSVRECGGGVVRPVERCRKLVARRVPRRRDRRASYVSSVESVLACVSVGDDPRTMVVDRGMMVHH